MICLTGKVMSSVDCEKHFPPVGNSCHGVMFMKGLVQANDIASVGATNDGFDIFQSGGLTAADEGQFFNHSVQP